MSSLDRLRREACRDVDAAAGAARLRYISDPEGQQAVYLRKLKQAEALVADSTSTPGKYLVKEAARTGSTPAAVAAMVVAIAELWDDDKSPNIEAERVGGKADVMAAAEDAAAIEAARDASLAALAAI